MHAAASPEITPPLPRLFSVFHGRWGLGKRSRQTALHHPHGGQRRAPQGNHHRERRRPRGRPRRLSVYLDYSNNVAKQLKDLGFRVRVDDRNESMGYKTRQIQKGKIPFMLVVGDQEMESETLNFRRYGSRDSESIKMDELTKMFTELNLEKMPESLR